MAQGAASVGEALELAAAQLDSVTRRSTSAGTEYSRGNRSFAFVETSGASSSFRLTPQVAAAAVRTPDTKASDRGAGWITLRPHLFDGHARDRAVAWFESAWRHAAD